jgi:pimeloyl-ACP methyl ester carboxylesterase
MLLAVLLALLLQTSAVPSTQSISETLTIEGAGTPLFVEIRGRAEPGPILLYLHGGPGSAIGLVAFRAYVGPALESDALVCYLHQRGVLGSPPVPDSTQTIRNHVADVLEVMDYLTRRFPGRPLFLLGHSWGGLLATHVALERPRQLAGVVLVSPSFDMQATLRSSYEQTLAWAKRANRSDAIQALTALGPPPYSALEQQLTLSQWSSSGNGGIDQRLDPAVVFGRPPYLEPDSTWIERELAVCKAMLTELYHDRTSDRVAGTKVPLLLLVGSRDLVTPPSSLREGYALWGGPKTFVEMADSHHLPFVDEPERFVAHVKAFTRETHGREP